MTDLREIAKRMVDSGFLFDTFPDHWACRICDTKEPHVHEVFKFGIWYWEDHGYDVRNEEQK